MYGYTVVILPLLFALATPDPVPVNTEIWQDLVERAKLANQAERYDDMMAAMREFVETGADLTIVERNLLKVAYKTALGHRRNSLRVLSSIEEKAAGSEKEQQMVKEYREKVGKELEAICYEVVTLLDEYLIPKADDPENKVFYLMMKADYYRYLAEFLSGDGRKTAAQNSLQAYEEAFTIAKDKLQPADPIRLGLVLNFSVFYYEILDSPDRARHVAEQTFNDAFNNLDTLDKSAYKDSVFIMQLIKDNLTLWLSDKAGDESDA